MNEIVIRNEVLYIQRLKSLLLYIFCGKRPKVLFFFLRMVP